VLSVAVTNILIVIAVCNCVVRGLKVNTTGNSRRIGVVTPLMCHSRDLSINLVYFCVRQYNNSVI